MTRNTLFLFFLCVGSPAARAGDPSIAGCPMYPSNNIWNTPIDNLPVHPMSDTYVYTVGAQASLHADFGSGYYFGGVPFGLPVNYVFGTQPKVPVYFDNPGESDPGPYPIPPDAGVQGDTDRHLIVLDKDNCLLYEMWDSRRNGDGSWSVGSGAKFDTRSNKLRPFGYTSANAAGVAFLPGLIRYDEIMTGEIRHAVGMTVNYTQDNLVWPARHRTVMNISPNFPPMGARFRLKASVDISGFDPQVQVLLRALKKYGAFVNDNGGPWFIAGQADPRWDDNIWLQLRNLHGQDFEMVDESSLMVDPDSGEARGMPLVAVAVAVAPGAATVPSGGGVQLSAQVTGATDTRVSWYVSGGGTITQGGWYQAPAGLAAPLTAVVTAISAVDSSKWAQSTITVTPAVVAAAGIDWLGLSTPAVQGGDTAAAIIVLTRPAPPGGASVSLTSSNPSAASVNPVLTIGEGASVGVALIPTARIAATASVTITAAAGGTSKSAVLAVLGSGAVAEAIPVSWVSLSTPSIFGGDTAAVIFALTQPAPAGGAAVTLSSSNPAVASVPAVVTIGAGQSVGVANIPTARVASPTAVTITVQGKAVTLNVY